VTTSIVGVELAVASTDPVTTFAGVELTPSLIGAQIEQADPSIAVLGEVTAVPVAGGSGSGTTDHRQLSHRSDAGAHPAAAISVADAGSHFTGTDVEAVLAELAGAGGAVDSVNGHTGVVVLTPDDLTDTATTHKFVTAAEKTKLANLSGTNTGDQDLSGLVPTSRTVNGHALTGNVTVTAGDVGAVPTSRTVAGHALTADVTISKSDVGLGSVDNTADTAKPVSTAQQAAIDGASYNTLFMAGV
jgi:hypothetical protein